MDSRDALALDYLKIIDLLSKVKQKRGNNGSGQFERSQGLELCEQLQQKISLMPGKNVNISADELDLMSLEICNISAQFNVCFKAWKLVRQTAKIEAMIALQKVIDSKGLIASAPSGGRSLLAEAFSLLAHYYMMENKPLLALDNLQQADSILAGVESTSAQDEDRPIFLVGFDVHHDVPEFRLRSPAVLRHYLSKMLFDVFTTLNEPDRMQQYALPAIKALVFLEGGDRDPLEVVHEILPKLGALIKAKQFKQLDHILCVVMHRLAHLSRETPYEDHFEINNLRGEACLCYTSWGMEILVGSMARLANEKVVEYSVDDEVEMISELLQGLDVEDQFPKELPYEYATTLTSTRAVLRETKAWNRRARDFLHGTKQQSEALRQRTQLEELEVKLMNMK